MNWQHRPTKLLITGKSGSGKTEYYIRYVKAVRSRYGQILIYDHEAEFSHRTGEQSFQTVEELQEYKGGVQCYDYAQMYPGCMGTGLEFYSDYTFQIGQSSKRPTLFCCDEMQKLIETDCLPTEISCVVETGRRYQIDTLFVSQQPNLLHNRLRNQVTEVVTFQHVEPRALDWLEDYGFQPDEVRGLAVGDYICRTDQGIERRGNIFQGRLSDKHVPQEHHKKELTDDGSSAPTDSESDADSARLEPSESGSDNSEGSP
jgi:hypothetical protein